MEEEKYSNLAKFLKSKGLNIKEKVVLTKKFNTLSTQEKWDLIERIARDLGYILDE